MQNKFFLPILALIASVQMTNAADQAAGSATGKKAIKVAPGYLNAAGCACKWANHCRDDLGKEEAEYMKYLDEGESKIKKVLQENGSPDEIQKAVFDYRCGLQARETLWGRCPGRCLSYDFPGDFRNASRLIARNNRIDILVDVAAIYYGADLVLKGPDLSEPTLVELKRSAR